MERVFLAFRQVKSGQLPVLDARVRAIISYTGRSVSQDQANNTVVVDLYDNGNAGKTRAEEESTAESALTPNGFCRHTDPDITKGDGVYSRYFAKFFRGAGTYSIKLSVDAMDGRAYSIRASSVSSGESSVQVERKPHAKRKRPSILRASLAQDASGLSTHSSTIPH